VLIPEDNTVFLIVVRNNATVRFVLPRRENAAVIELLIDAVIASSFRYLKGIHGGNPVGL